MNIIRQAVNRVYGGLVFREFPINLLSVELRLGDEPNRGWRTHVPVDRDRVPVERERSPRISSTLTPRAAPAISLAASPLK